MRHRFLPTLCAVGSMLALIGALRPVPSDAQAPKSETLLTPVWSPRRAPEVFARVVAASELEVDLGLVLNGQQSCVVVRDALGEVVAQNPVLSLAPASNQKLLVALVALHRLGPDFRYETVLASKAKPRDGVVENLWLIGGGDPVLTTAEYRTFLETQPLHQGRKSTSLERLADELARAGVREIRGRVLGDDARYDRTRSIPTWKRAYLSDREVGPLGALAVNEGWTSWLPRQEPAPDPAVHAASELARLAQDRGIKMDGAGRAKGDAKLPEKLHFVAKVTSPPLGEIVETMLRGSGNFLAELVVRELGHTTGTGSTEAGLRIVTTELEKLGLDITGLTLNDGSGLDVANRSTCSLLLGALLEAEKAKFKNIPDGLAVAGKSGTLARRMLDAPLAGRIRAKTGSIDGVVGLTGYADGTIGTLTFSFLANGNFSTERGRSLQERIATLLVRYPQTPPTDSLAPPGS